MAMCNEKESAWIIYVDKKIQLSSNSKAEGKVEILRKEYKGPVHKEGLFDVCRK